MQNNKTVAEPKETKEAFSAGGQSSPEKGGALAIKKQSLIIIILAAVLVVISVVGVVLALVLTAKPDTYRVEMDVDGYGTIKMTLDRKSAPQTVDNFVKLATSGFYNGITFHRAVKDFVIQGGDPNGTGTGGSPDKVYGEFSKNGYYGNHISHDVGVISMARANDMNSASSQFFITIADARNTLDGSYAGFGYIDEDSMSVVYAIAEYMIPLTTNGVITDKTKQPVITEVRVFAG